MNTIKQLERLRKIHEFIKIANTGTPKEFAIKLQLSESQLYNILEDLKIKGFPICYSKRLKSYVYNDDCELEIIYSVKLITSKGKIKISGGYLKKSYTLQCN